MIHIKDIMIYFFKTLNIIITKEKQKEQNMLELKEQNKLGLNNKKEKDIKIIIINNNIINTQNRTIIILINKVQIIITIRIKRINFLNILNHFF